MKLLFQLGLVGGWLAGENGIKAISSSKFKLKLELKMSMAKNTDQSGHMAFFTTRTCDLILFVQGSVFHQDLSLFPDTVHPDKPCICIDL